MAELTIDDLGRESKWRTFTGPPAGSFSWSVSPGEWTVLGDRPSGDVVDLTSVRAMFRLSGESSRELLAKICALDLGSASFPDGSVARTLIADVATEIIRDDHGGTLSYLLLPSRSFGRYLREVLYDAGEEFGLL